MKNENTTTNTELPSIGKLIKSTILAIGIAAIILVTIVLPAEYGIDPTGMGCAIGLLKMGEIKVSLAAEAAADRAGNAVAVSDNIDVSSPAAETAAKEVATQSKDAGQSDEMTFSLSPDEGKEIKLTMKKGEQVNFVWWTDGGRANFDVHADSKKLDISYHNYSKGSEKRSEGMIEAAFDGKHGWFWRNRSKENMTITLRVNGEYAEIKQLI